MEDFYAGGPRLKKMKEYALPNGNLFSLILVHFFFLLAFVRSNGTTRKGKKNIGPRTTKNCFFSLRLYFFYFFFGVQS